MNVIDKMVLLPYERYEILLKNCNDNKKEKTFINVLTQTDDAKEESERDFQSDKIYVNQKGYGTNDETANKDSSLGETKEKLQKRKPPPVIPVKRIKWIKF